MRTEGGKRPARTGASRRAPRRSPLASAPAAAEGPASYAGAGWLPQDGHRLTKRLASSAVR